MNFSWFRILCAYIDSNYLASFVIFHKQLTHFCFVFFFFNFSNISCQIWTCAETWKSAYIGCYATKYTKSWPSKSNVHRTWWSTTINVNRFTCTCWDMRIYTRQSCINATTCTRVSQLFVANYGKWSKIIFGFIILFFNKLKMSRIFRILLPIDYINTYNLLATHTHTHTNWM